MSRDGAEADRRGARGFFGSLGGRTRGPEDEPQQPGNMLPVPAVPITTQSILERARAGICGALITADSGDIPGFDPKMSSVLAAYDGGVVFVAHGYSRAPQVASIIAYLKRERERRGKSLLVQEVGLADIAGLYQANATRDRVVLMRTGIKSRKQREILDLIQEAVHKRTSDIHIQVKPNETVVEFRIDSDLVRQPSMTGEEGKLFLAAAHAMADRGAADANYIPSEFQGARISTTDGVPLPEGVQALRLQFNPAVNGGQILICRILYKGRGSASPLDDLRSLGYSETHLDAIQRAMRLPSGINIVAGVVNSGKSTSLAAFLRLYIDFTKGRKRVLTVEDPPEAEIAGAIQMPVANATSPEERTRKFNDALHGALRSDGNLILVGEIRSKESAELAMEGVLTGHIMAATVHTRTAIDIIARLRAFEIEDYKITTPGYIGSLWGQRLMPKLCPNCAMPWVPDTAPPELQGRLESIVGLDQSKLRRRGSGCQRCGGSGLIGRTLAAEVVLPDDVFLQHIARQDYAEARRYWREDMGQRSMLEHAVAKMAQGMIDPDVVDTQIARIEPDEIRLD